MPKSTKLKLDDYLELNLFIEAYQRAKKTRV